MWGNDEIYEKYDLLLPSKFDGGYLIITLFKKIKNGEINENFSINDIKKILEEIDRNYNVGVAQSERIIKNLLHYFIRSVPNEYGKYYLTDHAIRLVELMFHKLENLYKNFPLKESFDKYFIVRFKDISTITDLELKFGSEFIAGHKRIINDHLEALEDEISVAHGNLNVILHSNELDATALVKKFTEVFKTFGHRAEDINNAISSKDRFLRQLRSKVDEFYREVINYKHPENDEEKQEYDILERNWKRAYSILNDLDAFFGHVDHKIGNLRKQILFASGKLTELQLNFSSNSNFRLLIKRLFLLALENSDYDKDAIFLKHDFPIKQILQEKTQFFYPEYYTFEVSQRNVVIHIPRDEEYESEQLRNIEREIKEQEIISDWFNKVKDELTYNEEIDVNSVINRIFSNDGDEFVAINVAAELINFAIDSKIYDLDIDQHLKPAKNDELLTWKMNIKTKRRTTNS